ncbi:MAG: hypothetical protein K2X82_25035 [Gemmataceae bacterium]|nr:hypothetical protein [Gemmataceae bacterium]
MLHRLICLLCFVAGLACVMGADNCVLVTAPPNPKGAKGVLDGTGTFGVDPVNAFSSVAYYARDTVTKQQSSIPAATNSNNGNQTGTWSASLALVPGVYDAYGYLFTTTPGIPGQVNPTKSNVKNAIPVK